MTEFKSHGDVRMKYLVEVEHSDRNRMGQSFSNRREGGEFGRLSVIHGLLWRLRQ